MLQQWGRAALPGSSWRATRELAMLPLTRATSKRHYSSSGGPAQDLRWDELNLASQVAKWSGYCYVPAAQLAELVQADGLQLVAHGRTNYTSWYIADGCMNHRPLFQLASKLVATGAPAAAADHAADSSISKETSNSKGTMNSNSNGTHSLASTTASDALLPKARRTRFVFLRGVQWAAPDANVSAITQALVKFWPVPFPPSAGSQATTASHQDQQLQKSQWQQRQPPPSQTVTPLVAHAGVTTLACDLYRQIAPYLDIQHNEQAAASQQPQHAAAKGTVQQQADAHRTSGSPASADRASAVHEHLPVCIAGHSLGGSLGLLLTAQALLDKRVDPAHVQCFMFGSPPVLAHKDGGGGHRVLKLLGLPDHAIFSFVLEHDPIPRALMSADPTFHALKRYEPMRQLLEARGWISGATQQALHTVVNGLTGLLRLGSSRMSPEQGSGASSGAQHAADAGQQARPSMQVPDEPPIAMPVLSPSRFLFENVGSVYFMRGGAELVPISNTTQLDQLLEIAIEDFINQPARALQAVLDHHHVSYAHDLETAALALLRREVRARQLRQQQGSAQQRSRRLHTHARHQHTSSSQHAAQHAAPASRLQQEISMQQPQQQQAM